MPDGSGERNLGAISRTFGTSSVELLSRKTLVREVFDSIAPRYDLMNDLMSFGTHRIWKRIAAAQTVAAARRLEGPVIDLAGGTGDLTRLCRKGLPGRVVVNMDASPGMLAVAGESEGGTRALAAAEAEHLPLADGSAAGMILAFGLRNMTEPRKALAEIFRVLKPGASLAVLEFSTPYRWFAPFYNLYSHLVIPRLGAMVAGDKRAYRYLVDSIRQFPDVATMTAELQRAGFARVTVKRLSFGIAALHVAEKP